MVSSLYRRARKENVTRSVFPLSRKRTTPERGSHRISIENAVANADRD